MTELSVVMPAYNEADNIADAVAEVRRDVFGAVPDAEMVIVNDGSRDETGEIVARLAGEDPRIRLVSQANAGHGAALRNGMEEAEGRMLLLLDSDRQIALDRFPAHWALLENGADAVLGIRATRHDPKHRLVLSRWMHRMLRTVFGEAPRDTNIPYKLVPRAAWREARAVIPPGCLIPSALLGVWLTRSRWRIEQVEIEHRPREAGETVLKPWRLTKFCWRALGDVRRFRRALKRG